MFNLTTVVTSGPILIFHEPYSSLLSEFLPPGAPIFNVDRGQVHVYNGHMALSLGGRMVGVYSTEGLNPPEVKSERMTLWS